MFAWEEDLSHTMFRAAAEVNHKKRVREVHTLKIIQVTILNQRSNNNDP